MGMQSPLFMQSFDMIRLFKSIARRAGERNIDEFERQGQDVQLTVMPDEQVQQQAQAGNIVPLQ